MALRKYIDKHNESPQPFVWTAKVPDIPKRSSLLGTLYIIGILLDAEHSCGIYRECKARQGNCAGSNSLGEALGLAKSADSVRPDAVRETVVAAQAEKARAAITLQPAP